MLLIEALAPLSNEPTWEEWEPLLTGHGYRFALFDRLNRFYVAQEHPEILARIPSLPADWRSARHMYEIGRAPENPQHPDHDFAQELAHGFWATLPYLERELVATMLGPRAGFPILLSWKPSPQRSIPTPSAPRSDGLRAHMTVE